MKRITPILVLGLIAGCQPGGGGGGGGSVTVPIELTSGLGTFEAQAGQPERRTGSVTFSTSGGDPGAGSFAVDLEAIEVTPTGGGKNAILFQGGELVVTAFIDSIDNLETVCETGERYGPYTITLDESNVPVSVDPATIELSETTLELFAAGEFSLCIEVVSPFDSTVTIENFEVELEL